MSFSYSQEFTQSLASLFGERVTDNPVIREQHGHGESHHAVAPPDFVVFVENEAEVVALVQLCGRFGVPMIAFGAGTSIEGQLQALQGGVSVDFSRMNRILQVDADDLACVVEPGVTREQLNQYLRDTGLFFPVDPGANATVGGMIATGASGTTTIRYGGMKANVMGLRAVLASGDVIVTGSGARKSSAGFNLTELLVGSEGTLGLITQARLRLYGIPESALAVRVQFADVLGAVRSVIELIQLAVSLARIELLDQNALRAVNRYCKTDYPLQPTLFMEFHGTPAATAEQADIARDICVSHGGMEYVTAVDEADKKRMWHARHNAYYAALAQVPNGKGWVTDVCVPISRLADCIAETAADLQAEALSIPIVGHVGDGNFHLLFSIVDGDSAALEQAKRINGRLIERAHRMGGTCTGEHGIGMGKKQWLPLEKNPATVAAMQAIKQALDPQQLFNPGKLF
ncbi:MAG: FAD-linked oxidase C-terminal domain-containing protein [Gammaproteobacteria bacterium]